SLSDLLPASLPPHTAAHAWRFYHLPPSTPREADTHWRVLHGALLTRRRQFKMGVSSTDACLFCGARDTLPHALFACPYSASYWTNVVDALSTSLSDAISPSTFSAAELLLGLPTLTAIVDATHHPTLRAAAAVSLQVLVEARQARIRPNNPTATSPPPASLAHRALQQLAARLTLLLPSVLPSSPLLFPSPATLSQEEGSP
ncbi:hypothetical protein JCM5296_002175, partial [Sporobolomyces johnsonii]